LNSEVDPVGGAVRPPAGSDQGFSLRALMEGHEGRPEQVQTEDLVLDIGEGVGALVLYTDPDLVGQEIEVSFSSQDRPRTHTAVHERRVMGRTVCAGVYPELPAGDYRIWTDEPRPVTEFTIVSGRVTEVDWRR
jgi:hypothetical protein